ncbi:MAG: peroxiredoxin family protein, partial [Verrucomicrobiota bacterium]
MYRILFLSFVFSTFIVSRAEATETGDSLEAAIAARKAEFRASASDEKIAAYANGIEAVVKAGVVESARKAGDKAPDFTLPNAKGVEVSLATELEKGPVVLTWYRGGWCPYCNIQLAAYQKVLPQFEELGAQLIAVSPELPDKSLSTAEKNSLRF